MEFKPDIPEKLKVGKQPPELTVKQVADEDGAYGVQEELLKKPEKSPVSKNAAPVAKVEIDDAGTFKALTIEGRYRIAQYAVASRMVPKSYSTPEQVLIGMEYALELGLRPLTGLRNIAVINGTPSIFGELPLAMVQRSGLMEWYDEQILDKDLKVIAMANSNLNVDPYAGWGKYKRKGGSTVERFFTIEDAKRAGLLSKGGPWLQYPRRMLQMRARSQALKDLFPDVLLGIAISEYDMNLAPEIGGLMRDVSGTTGEKTDAEKLKEAMKTN